jgi:iron-sulfur cluster repair protein YtfE (RIC family)
MAATRKKTDVAKPVDALTLLKKDHKMVMGLLEDLEKATGQRRAKLFDQVEQELTIHMQIEEEILYPAYQSAARKKDDQTMYYEAVEEHGVVENFLPQARDGANKEELKAKAKVLKELVQHHVEEEQRDMFPRIKKVFDRDELHELGARLQQRKNELIAG